MTHETIVVFESDWEWMRIERDRLRAEVEALFVKNVHLTGNQLKTETVDLIAELRRERDRLRAENEKLRALLAEAADELKDSYDLAYPDRQKYPDEMRRYEREMRLANRIRDALRGEGE